MRLIPLVLFSLLFIVSVEAQDDLLWARKYESLKADRVVDAKIDKLGNLYHVLFLGEATSFLINGAQTAVSRGYHLQQVSDNGDVQWDFLIPGTYQQNFTLNENGEAFFSVEIYAQVDLNTRTGGSLVGASASVSSPESFVLKINEDGFLAWYKQVDYLNSYQPNEFLRLAANQTGGVYVSGWCIDHVKIGNKDIIDPSSNFYFLASVDNAGQIDQLKKIELIKVSPFYNRQYYYHNIGSEGGHLYLEMIIKDINLDFNAHSSAVNDIPPDYFGIARVKYDSNLDFQKLNLIPYLIYHGLKPAGSLSIIPQAPKSMVFHSSVYSTMFTDMDTLRFLSDEGYIELKQTAGSVVVFKADTSGNLNWIRQFNISKLLPTPSGQTPGIGYTSLTEGHDGNLFMSLILNYVEVDTDPGAGTGYKSGSNTSIVLELDPQGIIVGSKVFPHFSIRHVNAYKSDSSLYLGGLIDSTIVLGNPPDTIRLSMTSFSDGVEMKLGSRTHRDIMLSTDSIMCVGDSLYLEANDTRTGDTYKWSTGDSSTFIWVKNPGIYWVEVKNGVRTYFDSINIIQATKPTVYIGPDSAFCDLVDITLQPKTNANKFLWNTGDTSKNLYVNLDGTYSLRVQDSLHCFNEDTIHLSVINTPFGVFSGDTFVCEQSLNLDAGNDGAEYLWSTGSVRKQITVFSDGWYSVEISRQYCTIRDSIHVDFKGSDSCGSWIYIPNSFTPNDDDLNSDFFISYNGISQLEVNIFSRWGEQLFYSNKPDFRWNGRYKNTELPVGVYMYSIRCLILEGTDYEWKTFKGYIHLLR